MAEMSPEPVADTVDGQLFADEEPVKTRHPAARKQKPLRRDRKVKDQARLLWDAMLTYARQQQRMGDGGFYWDAHVQEIAKLIFKDIWWDDPKHVSNFLRPILAYLQQTGNIKIIRRMGGVEPFFYAMWIRDEWSNRTATVHRDDANGANVRAVQHNVLCACGKEYLTNAGFSQHKKTCVTYQQYQETLAYLEEKEQEAEPEVEQEGEPFEPIPGIEGLSGAEYSMVARAAKNAVRREDRTAQRQAAKYEAILRTLHRDWKRRTPESMANIFATLDKLTF